MDFASVLWNSSRDEIVSSGNRCIGGYGLQPGISRREIDAVDLSGGWFYLGLFVENGKA